MLVKKTLSIILAASVMCSLAACQTPEETSDLPPDMISGIEYPPDEVPGESSEETDVVAFSEDFDQSMVEFMRKNGYDDRTFVISPLSLRAVSCLLVEGAKGDTLDQLLEGLDFEDQAAARAWYEHWANTEETDEFQLELASSLWNNELSGKPTFTEEYQAVASDVYGASLQTLPADQLTDAINAWAKEKSHGLISDLNTDFSEYSNLLFNTLYCKAAWLRPFDEANTKKDKFVYMDGSESEMDFMEQTNKFLYTENDGTQIAAFPLSNGLHLVCFLGNRQDMFEKMSGLEEAMVHVKMPKLDLAFGADSMVLMNFLLSRGVEDAFDWRLADFGGMYEDTGWFVSQMMQGSRFRITESGIEAAAATGIMMDTTSVMDDEVKEFILNKPFAFSLVSGLGSEEQTMLFFGQVMNQ